MGAREIRAARGVGPGKSQCRVEVEDDAMATERMPEQNQPWEQPDTESLEEMFERTRRLAVEALTM